MRIRTVISALAAVSVVTAGFAAPASADVFNGNSLTVNGNSWTFSFSNLSLTQVNGDYAWDGSGITFYGADDSTNTNVSCADPADLSDATDGSGDKILTCDAMEVDNGSGVLTVIPEFRFYAATPVVRERIIITNNTGTAVENQVVRFNFNAYQDNLTNLSWSACCGILDDWSTVPIPGNGFATDATDLMFITDDRENQNSTDVVKYAVADADAISLPANDVVRGWESGGIGGTVGSASDNTDTVFEVPSIAPGETVEYMVFAQVFAVDDSVADAPLSDWETGTRDAIIAAAADTALTDDAVLYAGIDDATRILNWAGPSNSGSNDDGGSDLAATGFDTAPLGTIALFALAGGIALVVRRRAVK